MADASEIDIGGVRWNVKDKDARNKIATIEDFLTPKEIPNIEITLNNGYSATEQRIEYVQKYGKLYMGLLYINNLSGKNIGTTEIANFGKANISLNKGVFAVGIEYSSSLIVRAAIGKTGIISLQESKGITPGKNYLRIPITWIEE